MPVCSPVPQKQTESQSSLLFRNQNKMPLQSAAEDFLDCSLPAVPGILEKLRYTASLRGGDGCGHWGLARVHGRVSATRALKEVHRKIFASVLREPIAQLWEDTIQACRARKQEPAEYILELSEQWKSLLPNTRQRSSERHFMSVLRALSGLAKSLEGAIRPNA